MQIHLNETIRAQRKARGLTQEQLAEAMGVSIGAVSKWESGLSNPDLALLPELADFFECSVDVLLGYDVQCHSMELAVDRIHRLGLEKRYDEGVTEAQKALVKYPNAFRVVYESAKLFNRRGMDCQEKESLRRSMTLYEKAAMLIDQNTDEGISFEEIQSCIGGILAALDETERAIAHLRKYNVCGVNNVLIGGLLVDEHRWEEALPLLSTGLVNTYADFCNLGFYMASCLSNLGELEEALELSRFMREAVGRLAPQGQPSVAQMLAALYDILSAAILACLGDWEAAREMLTQSLEEARDFDRHPDFQARNLKFYHGKDQTLFGSLGTNAHQAVVQILHGVDPPERDRLLAILGEWEAAQ